MEELPSSFLSLPDAVCDEVLLQLGQQDFGKVALVCRQLREAVNRNSLWVQLCQRTWASNTSVHNWLVDSPGTIFHDRARVRPVDFR